MGMVVDFADIGQVYKDWVEPFVEHQDLNDTLDLPEYTTEHLAYWIFCQMKPRLPSLHAIKVWEGKTSYAMFQEGDQLR
jgi:6-pyruvoyltetrahydropterin/6-carboxytetrahydropterin synthase